MKKNAIIATASLILTLISIPLSGAVQEQAPELSDITINRTAARLEARLVLGSAVNYESFTLFNPNRLVIDLLQVRNYTCDPEIAIDTAGVARVRTAKNQPDVTRVVFDLGENVPAYAIEETENGLMVAFTPAEPVAEEVPAEKPAAKAKPPAETETRIERPAPKPKITPPPPPAPRTRREAARDTETERGSRRIGVSLDGGLYFVHSADFQDIYGKSTFSWGGGLSFSLPLSSREDLGFSLDFHTMSATGETSYTGEELTLNMMPLSLTIFYTRHLGSVSPFAGIGGDYFSYKEEYPDTFPVSAITGNIIGYNILLGTYLNFTRNFSAKAYFKLHMAKKTENEVEINMSGNEFGIGLVYFFNLK